MTVVRSRNDSCGALGMTVVRSRYDSRGALGMTVVRAGYGLAGTKPAPTVWLRSEPALILPLPETC